jgi:hypothetical protein
MDFNSAVKAFKSRDFNLVSEYIKNGNPPMQFLEDNLIEVELISLVSHFSSLDKKIINHIDKKIDINQTTNDDLKYTAVHLAAWDGKEEILKYLLKKEANPDCVGADGYSPLHLAASNGRFSCVKLLVQSGAQLSRRVIDENIFFPVGGATPFRLSFFNGFFDISEYLFDKGADVSEIIEPCQAPNLKSLYTIDIVRKLGIRNEIDNFSTEKFDKVVKLFNEKFDLDILDFQIREDVPGPWPEEYDKAFTVGGLSNDKDKDFVEFLDKLNLDNNGIKKVKLQDSKNIDYPVITWIKDKKVKSDIVMNYGNSWQGKSSYYKNKSVIGIVPEFIKGFIDGQFTPLLSEDESTFINQKIVDDKIIPVLSYAPEECFHHTKNVWWIIPFCIWKEDVISYVFLDKNGFYAPVPCQNKMNSELKMIFSWDAISDLSFDKGIDSLNLNRLTLKMDEGFLTFDEFTATSVSKSHGSYLSMVESIWNTRKLTIEKSKGSSTWKEGAGGEGFKSFNSPKELLDPLFWNDPDRPNQTFFV